MKIFIDSTNRFHREISLFSSAEKLVGDVNGEADVLVLLDQILKKYKVKLSDLKEIKAKMEGESRVGILIGVSGANALNYALGLKKVSELEYPKDPEGGIL